MDVSDDSTNEWDGELPKYFRITYRMIAIVPFLDNKLFCYIRVVIYDKFFYQ